MKIYVISGGPGTGKTATINKLRKEFKILPETARKVANKDKRFIGKSIKQINMKDFQNAIFLHQKKTIEKLKKYKPSTNNSIIFSDRGLGDTIAYYKINNLEIPQEVLEYAKNFRYDEIFILDFLNFYAQDELRQENKEEQKKIHETIIKTYEELGYKPIIIPFSTIKNRTNIIKSYLK
ncbi:MAG: ATP-binding protein [Nanoarchaeota archaeon]|nr:ATP-binding protein [Nanoarchaeota archaeon]